MTLFFRGHATGVPRLASKLLRRAFMEAMQSWRVERCSLPLGGLILVDCLMSGAFKRFLSAHLTT